jgi:catechol 2,3-dioxygenase-like lactoylglutathione lyase family enzyme
MTLKVQALDHLVVQVSDLEVSASWYERVLGMTREDVPPAPGKPPRTAMRFGRHKINLRPIAASKEDWFTADHEAAAARACAFSPTRRPIRSSSTCGLNASPSRPAPGGDRARWAR